jgi:hypothetical protein
MSEPSKAVSLLRALALIASAALVAGCLQTTSNEPPIEPMAAPAAQATPAQPPPRGERVPTVSQAEGPVSVEQARTDCWMRYEKDRSARDIDAKLKLVEKCVNDRMAGRQAR